MCSVEVADQPLDLSRMYRLVTCSFLAAGKEGFNVLSGALRLTDHEYEQPIQAVMMEHIKSTGVVCAHLDGRMKPRFEPMVRSRSLDFTAPMMPVTPTLPDSMDVSSELAFGRSSSCPHFAPDKVEENWRKEMIKRQF